MLEKIARSECYDIYVDKRETIGRFGLKDVYENLVFQTTTIRKFEKFHIKKRQLISGDIVCGNLAIERKTIDDARRSIHNGRIFNQCFKMAENYKHIYLLIEGELSELAHPRDIKAILSTLADVELRYNIKVRFCMNLDYLCYYLLILCRKLQTAMNPIHYIQRPEVREKDERLNVLLGIRGVGRKTARSLLMKFKSVKNVGNATVDELKAINRVNKKRAEHIYNIFNSEELDETWKVNSLMK